MGCCDEVTSKNFSLYGQWLGLISVVLLIALGIVGFVNHIVFSIVGWVLALILLFVEIPLCLKCCPTSPKLFAVVMFLSTLMDKGPLIAAAVSLLLAAICYGAGAATGQSFASSKYLGGTGVDNVKLTSLRGEVEAANTRADDAEARVKQLEAEHTQKDHELSSLESRVKLLQEQLDKAELDFKEASENFREADLRAEQFEKKANNLQQELETMELKSEEMTQKYQAAKAEMDDLERQLEGV
ncbi:hypothetical protein BDB00DRAFT_884950 [Zychaea mexicana]|uniref:uncharacterized protein n=1 Tax=Zychaea mexicana TaxID=64656 RepID=UPI0022FDE86E|nr:uncharacterized protein BDB00DRAFT_884950 [Zychaea mexicana]KAI9488133.1 hypothetical protein BDB00DRAFT_884950 [Zychaea mexicana]